MAPSAIVNIKDRRCEAMPRRRQPPLPTRSQAWVRVRVCGLDPAKRLEGMLVTAGYTPIAAALRESYGIGV